MQSQVICIGSTGDLVDAGAEQWGPKYIPKTETLQILVNGFAVAKDVFGTTWRPHQAAMRENSNCGFVKV